MLLNRIQQALTALFLLPTLALTQELHTFKNGEVADAEKINENFKVLENRIDAVPLSNGRPQISITTESVVTQASHPFVASISSSRPLFRVGYGMGQDRWGTYVELFSDKVLMNPTDPHTIEGTLSSSFVYLGFSY